MTRLRHKQLSLACAYSVCDSLRRSKRCLSRSIPKSPTSHSNQWECSSVAQQRHRVQRTRAFGLYSERVFNFAGMLLPKDLRLQ